METEALLSELIRRLKGHERIVRRYRDWFDVDAQYVLHKKSTGRADVEFHRQFMEYEYHAHTIVRCRRDIARIENTYTEVLEDERNRYRVLLEGKTRSRCNEVRRLTHGLVLHLDAVIKRPQRFHPHGVFSRLRRLSIKLKTWYTEAEESMRAHQKAKEVLRRG